MPKAKRPNFKGLGASLAQNALVRKEDHPVRHFVADEGLLQIPIEMLRPDSSQPRQYFDPEALQDLTASILQNGILEPIIARKDPERDGYIIVAGERRWRAASAAMLSNLPALVGRYDDPFEIALIENMQRQNLNAIEEAEGLLRLKETRGLTDQELSRIIGKSRQSVSESITLNGLPDDIKDECRTSGIGTKSQLLEILRAGSAEAMHDAWQAFRSGEAKTVREIRKRSSSTKGRPESFKFAYSSPSGRFRLSIAFSQPEAASLDVQDALEEAIASLGDPHNDRSQ